MNRKIDKGAVILVATLSSFLTPFAASSFNIALPSIGREFLLDAITLSWASLAYLLSSAMFLVPFGKLADIYGRKRVFVYGTAVFTLCSGLLAVFPSTLTLIPLRAVQGVGTAMIFGTGVAILISVFPAEEKGKVLGINVAAVYVGLSIGPSLGGLLTEGLGWRSIFLVNVVLGLITVVFAATRISGEWVEAVGERFDLVGSVIYSLMLFSLMYGFSLLPSPQSVWPLVLGVVGFFAFYAWELRAKNPVLDLNLFRTNRGFTFSNLAALINYSATYAATFLMSLYLQYLRGLSPSEAGVIMIAQPVVQALVAPVAGRLSDRIEPRMVASVGMAVTAMGLVPFTLLDDRAPLTFIIGGLVLMGLGLALFSSPNTNAIMSSVERRLYGVASATAGTMRLTGQMLSMGITMMIFAVFVGKVEIVPSIYPQLLVGIRYAFATFTVLCFVGIFASFTRTKVR